ncbi:pyridoxamine 5'-phosphate oxidase family protein [Desulfuromonas sp. DDH964]|uniref:pyridoxamine 5'-phosphate oxidase family protein n=1 Tax=Desulfuromonas sp. DDH964 TaxID=1823759 RepID=UPI001E54E4EA|nr:pyridoxamine 5'-phosphate oxidase family protein [Desulfuromonas sp. DDH964]
MRRKDRELAVDAAMELLARGEYGVLSTTDIDGQPYGIPVSYAYRHPAIYIHCAPEGHKLDNLHFNPKVSFCVVGKTRVLPELFSTEYESVIAFGVAAEVAGAEREKALVWLLEKYSPQQITAGEAYIASTGHLAKVIKLEITALSGKARRA